MPETDAPNKKKCATMVIIEEYPDGMTREEYQQHLHAHAEFFARLLLERYPDIVEIVEVEPVELKKAA